MALTARVAVVLMHGRLGESPGERLVEAARRAAALDVFAALQRTDRFGPFIVVTDDAALAQPLATAGARVEASGAQFHFGQRLAAIVAAHRLERVLYVGAGSGALTEASEWVALADALQTESVVVANNFLSADYVAFTPGAALQQIEPPPLDNDLPWRLNRSAGLTKLTRPRSLGSEVDIDTPSDLALLALATDLLPPHLAGFVAQAADLTRLLAPTMDRLLDLEARLLVAGRVSASAWAELERGTMRYTRLISEERGMRASGRLERGEVRSLLGHLLSQLGAAAFFTMVGDLADVALVDSRVLFAHLGLRPTVADRFASDRLCVDEIAEPRLRAFTAAAAAAPLPVLLGGHSLVSGGLWLLAHLLRQRRQPEGTPAGSRAS